MAIINGHATIGNRLTVFKKIKGKSKKSRYNYVIVFQAESRDKRVKSLLTVLNRYWKNKISGQYTEVGKK